MASAHLEVSHWSTTVLADVSLCFPCQRILSATARSESRVMLAVPHARTCLGAWLKVCRLMALLRISTVNGMGPPATAAAAAAGASPAMRRPERLAVDTAAAWRPAATWRSPRGACGCCGVTQEGRRRRRRRRRLLALKDSLGQIAGRKVARKLRRGCRAGWR